MRNKEWDLMKGSCLKFCLNDIALVNGFNERESEGDRDKDWVC